MMNFDFLIKTCIIRLMFDLEAKVPLNFIENIGNGMVQILLLLFYSDEGWGYDDIFAEVLNVIKSITSNFYESK